MRGTDIAAGHHQIGNVLGIQAAQRNWVHLWRPQDGGGRQIRTVKAAWRMVIHRPTAHGDGIGESAGKQNLSGQNMIAGHAAAPSLSGHHTYPIHGPVDAIGVVAAVLDVIPNSYYDGQQLISNQLVVPDGVFDATPLHQ